MYRAPVHYHSLSVIFSKLYLQLLLHRLLAKSSPIDLRILALPQAMGFGIPVDKESVASQPSNAAPRLPATAFVVGNAFVNKYYNVLLHSPHVVHRFYTDESRLSRAEAGPDGAVDTVVSQAGIDSKIMSLDYGDFRAEIKTVDSQESLNGSVLVMVTGSLSSHSSAKRNFVETFFLAPQEKGYFVLNDMFRYLDGELQSLNPLASMSNGSLDRDPTPDVPEQGPVDSEQASQQEVRDNSNSTLEEAISVEDRYQPVDDEEHIEIEESTAEEVTPSAPEVCGASEEEIYLATEEENSEEAPKKSYASILRFRSNASGAPVVAAQTAVNKAVPAQADRFATSSQGAQVGTPSAGSKVAPEEPDEGIATDLEGDGRSVYVKNLPLSITLPELEEEFQKFGALKPGGVNLKNQRVGVCFAFIEFMENSSAQSAIEASPIYMGGRQVYVEEKRPMAMASRAGGGRFNQGRGYPGDGSMRGRGYFGGRGYGRGVGQDSVRDFNNRGRGVGPGSGNYGRGNNYASNNYSPGFNFVNGYRRADSQGWNGPRSLRRGSGYQLGRGPGRGSAAE